MSKKKYPMMKGPFLGLVIDYEKLICQQASNSNSKRIPDEKVKIK